MGSPTRGPFFWESQPPVVGLKSPGSRAQQEFTHVGRNGWAFLGRGYKTPLSFPPELLYILYPNDLRSEEHTSELQSRGHLVCRLLLEKKKNITLQLTL